jgi:hypothetical protein
LNWKLGHSSLPDPAFPYSNSHTVPWVYAHTCQISSHNLSRKFTEYPPAAVCMAPCTRCIRHWARSRLSFAIAFMRSILCGFMSGVGLISLSFVICICLVWFLVNCYFNFCCLISFFISFNSIQLKA